MTPNKMPKAAYRKLVAQSVLTALEKGANAKAICVLLTIGLATMDQTTSTFTPTKLFVANEDELTELTHPVGELLDKEGGHLDEPRFQSAEFWEDFIANAERELRGFSKKKA